MPRDGNGVYSAPPGTTATPNTTILSDAYNALVADLTTDLNAARPISAGGTGASTLTGLLKGNGTSPFTAAVQGTDYYAPGGTDVALADGGTGASLTDPGGDRILFWDDSAGAVKWLTASTGLTISTTSMTVRSASTSQTGIVELATEAEALAGTSTSLAVTPAGLYYPSGHLYGLTLSNNGSDATNDIDIAVGTCRSSDDSANIDLASALTGKQLDTAWAVGSSAGLLATGVAVTNTTYYIFAIKRPDTGVVDAAADTSSTGANIAANTNAAYTIKRLVGIVIRSGGVNGVPFTLPAFATVTNYGRISFPPGQNASSDANTLDDYEEGQTTPTITAGSGTFTTVSAVLDYTKIGRLVTVTVLVTVTNAGTASGTVNIPLPFTSGAGAVGSMRNLSTGITGVFIVSPTSSSGFLSSYNASTAYIATGQNLRATLTYFV